MQRISASAILFFVVCSSLLAQTKVGYVATDIIRDRLPAAQQAEKQLETITAEWKKELEDKRMAIDRLRNDIDKNRLIWSDSERIEKQQLLDRLTRDREKFAKDKFGAGGEFDLRVRELYKPIEEKIAAAIQEVALTEGFDMVWDKSKHPLVYVNPKYDITVKVMERLEIDVADLREKWEKQVESTPQREDEGSDQPRRRRRRRPSTDEVETQQEVQPEHSNGDPQSKTIKIDEN